MNRKGFTLVELLATITILGIIVAIGGIAVSGVMTNARQKEYELLVQSIKSAAEVCYQENTYKGGVCGEDQKISLSELISEGYISNLNGEVCDDKGENCTKTLINPKDNKKISDCIIEVTYEADEKKIKIEATNNNASGSCPSTDDYKKY